MTEKTGLVLEGGGVRGAYTAGTLSWLAKQEIYLDYNVGISTGAAYLALYLSHETKIAREMSTGFAVDPQNVGVRALLKCGHFVDGDRIFTHYLKEVEGFEVKGLREEEMKMNLVKSLTESGKALQIAPSSLVKVNRFKGDRETCRLIYEMGYGGEKGRDSCFFTDMKTGENRRKQEKTCTARFLLFVFAVFGELPMLPPQKQRI